MRRAAIFAIVLTLLTACAARGPSGDVAFRGDVTSEEKESLLRERVAEYWGLMIKKEWLEAYLYYDPFFRARITREGFMQGKGLLVYYSASIEEMDMKGNIADLGVKVEYEAPKIVMMGKTTNIPRQERVLRVRWLWIYDNWYREFKGGRRTKFTRY